MKIKAVSFDFYDTLVYHRTGRGRGAELMGYLAQQGWDSGPWEHQVLYDLFEPHGRDYSPDFSSQQKQRYLRGFARRLLQRLDVQAPAGAAERHAGDIWRLMGPASLSVFADAPQLLSRLKDAGLPLVMVSNWQRGLRHFCTELGLGEYFDQILASAEVGSVKPDAGIFREACRRLKLPAEEVLHVGDSLVDDYQGGRGAGLQAVLVRRNADEPVQAAPVIKDLSQLAGLLGLAGQPGQSASAD